MIMYHDDKKYIKPNFFIKNYDNQIIDIYNKKDAGEFLLDLLDKVEKYLLTTNYKNLIKYLFKGKYKISYSFGNSCKYKINKIEPFYNVNLDIDKDDNIEDSLENLITIKSIHCFVFAGITATLAFSSFYFEQNTRKVNGDNKIFYEKCNKKICLSRNYFRNSSMIINVCVRHV